jgi:hypothetical protein
MKVRLTNDFALALGLALKPYTGNGNPRYYLNSRKERLYLEIKNKGVVEACANVGADPTTAPMLWLKTKQESVRVTNPLFIKPEIKEEMQHVKELHESFIKEAKKYAFIYPTFERQKSTENHCLVVDAADIHLGKICRSFETGETYNSQIAVQRVRDGLKGIIQKASGFHKNKVIFIAGNDILHVDNAHGTTTRGTKQDTDGMWYDNFMMAKRLLVEIIETLLTIADVEVVYNPSNHDFTHGFMLLDSVSSWFHNCKQVTFDNDMRHRKYTVYGNNLIGTTHMDGIKVDKLHALMAEEASEHWHACKHRYFFGHHVHHTSAKDVFSVCIETLRSPSGTDGWHHRAGFQHAPKAVVGFLHHETQGQVAKLTHIF